MKRFAILTLAVLLAFAAAADEPTGVITDIGDLATTTETETGYPQATAFRTFRDLLAEIDDLRERVAALEARLNSGSANSTEWAGHVDLSSPDYLTGADIITTTCMADDLAGECGELTGDYWDSITTDHGDIAGGGR